MLDETVLPLSKVPGWVQEHAGFKPNRSTVFRWKTRGCNGKRLSTFRIGGRVCTTVEALLDFFATDGELSDSLPPQQSPTHDQADAYLAAEGI